MKTLFTFEQITELIDNRIENNLAFSFVAKGKLIEWIADYLNTEYALEPCGENEWLEDDREYYLSFLCIDKEDLLFIECSTASNGMYKTNEIEDCLHLVFTDMPKKLAELKFEGEIWFCNFVDSTT